jgi:hypothetical protein
LIARRRIQTYGTVEASVRLLVEGVTIKPLTAEIAALQPSYYRKALELDPYEFGTNLNLGIAYVKAQDC